MSYEEILSQLIEFPRLSRTDFFEGRGRHIINIIGTKVKTTDNLIAFSGSALWFGPGEYQWYLFPARENGNIYSVDEHENMKIKSYEYPDLMNRRSVSYRMALPYSLIEDICVNKELCGESAFGNEVYKATLLIDEIGSNVGREMGNKLEKLLNNGQLEQVDCYPSDGVSLRQNLEAMNVKNSPIYEWNGKKFMRLVLREAHNKKFEFLNKEKYERGAFVWFEMKNPKIFFDSKNNFAIFEDLTISGIRPIDLDEYLKNHFFPRLAKQIKNAKDKVLDENKNSSQIFETSFLIEELLRICSGDVNSVISFIEKNFKLDIAKGLLTELRRRQQNEQLNDQNNLGRGAKT